MNNNEKSIILMEKSLIMGGCRKKLTLSFSAETINALFEAEIITAEQKTLNPNSLSIEIDPVVAKYCIDLIKNNPQMNVLFFLQKQTLKIKVLSVMTYQAEK